MPPPGSAPAFQFYAADWLSDEHVRTMTLEETGAYIDALALCWREGSIPADPEKLARLIGKGCSIDVATQVQLRFNISSTGMLNGHARLEHKRLNIEREKQALRSRQMSAAGKKSAARKSKHLSAATTCGDVNSSSTQVQPKYNSSSSSSDEDGGVPPTPKSVRSRVHFIKPTIEEVAAYCRERRNTVNPVEWMSHYEANGWKVGRNAMKDWRAAVRTWEASRKPKEPIKPTIPSYEEIVRRGYNPVTGLGPE